MTTSEHSSRETIRSTAPARSVGAADADAPKRSVALIRNIGIIAHIDAGKTTLTERLLYYSGRTHRVGDVDAGTTVTDWMAQERERGITITAAVIMIPWRDDLTRQSAQINIVDTPGHIDFTAEVQRSLRVLDAGVVVFDAVAGVEPQSETVWHQADQYAVPRICFVNKMDRPGADLERTLRMIRERLNAKPAALQLPIYEDEVFVGVVDLIQESALVYSGEAGAEPQQVQIPEALAAQVRVARERLVEAVAATDEELTERYLAGEPLVEQALIRALRKAVLENKLVPVFMGSALHNRGIQPVLDAIVRYLPSPLDLPCVEGVDPVSGEPLARAADPQAPFCAMAFKVVSDPWVGRLSYLRVYSGTLDASTRLLNTTRQQTERVSRVLRMSAQKREDIGTCCAGDIVAVVGLKHTYTGDTLCDPDGPILLEQISFPAPVIRVAVAPVSTVEQDKLFRALRRLADEDPTFQTRYDTESGQTLINGMGELHLEIIVDRLLREFGVECSVGPPQPAYRETITRQAKGEGRYIHQSGGSGSYAVVRLALSPGKSGEGFGFENQAPVSQLPLLYISAIEHGIRGAMEAGELAGFPVTDVRVVVTGGRFHEVDSHRRDFEIAGSMAFKAAYRRASAVLLEPVMQVATQVGDEHIGPVIKDLATRRGTVTGVESETEGRYLVKAEVPLRTMFGYVTGLRSLTSGHGSFTMQFAHYEPVDAETAAEIISEQRVDRRRR
ncbi:MAG: elongation factor G [Anaerolineae bacterium]|nr:elongation factor G [Anaerolineae bacterium]